jgi:hypothetical protein
MIWQGMTCIIGYREQSSPNARRDEDRGCLAAVPSARWELTADELQEYREIILVHW